MPHTVRTQKPKLKNTITFCKNLPKPQKHRKLTHLGTECSTSLCTLTLCNCSLLQVLKRYLPERNALLVFDKTFPHSKHCQAENKTALSMAQHAKLKSEPAKIIIQKISKLGEKKNTFAYAMHQTITMKFQFQESNVLYNDLLKVLILNTKKKESETATQT